MEVDKRWKFNSRPSLLVKWKYLEQNNLRCTQESGLDSKRMPALRSSEIALKNPIIPPPRCTSRCAMFTEPMAGKAQARRECKEPQELQTHLFSLAGTAAAAADITIWPNSTQSQGLFQVELVYASVQFSSVAQSWPTLCDPMDCSTPGLPVYRQLPEFAQTHVHPVSDAIQPSILCHPFSSCLQSFPASGFFPKSQFFESGGQSIGAYASASVLPMNIQDWFPLGLTGLVWSAV